MSTIITEPLTFIPSYTGKYFRFVLMSTTIRLQMNELAAGICAAGGDDDGFFLKNRYLRTVVFAKKLCILLDLT